MLVSGKRRFGVSIGGDLADTLDAVAEKLGLTRSKLVERALQLFLEDHAHLVKPHVCTGIIMTACAEPRGTTSQELPIVLEEFRDIVTTHTHTHVGDYCIDLIIVKGNSDRIASLHKRLQARLHSHCKTRYIPLFID